MGGSIEMIEKIFMTSMVLSLVNLMIIGMGKDILYDEHKIFTTTIMVIMMILLLCDVVFGITWIWIG